MKHNYSTRFSHMYLSAPREQAKNSHKLLLFFFVCFFRMFVFYPHSLIQHISPFSIYSAVGFLGQQREGVQVHMHARKGSFSFIISRNVTSLHRLLASTQKRTFCTFLKQTLHCPKNKNDSSAAQNALVSIDLKDLSNSQQHASTVDRTLCFSFLLSFIINIYYHFLLSPYGFCLFLWRDKIKKMHTHISVAEQANKTGGYSLSLDALDCPS